MKRPYNYHYKGKKLNYGVIQKGTKSYRNALRYYRYTKKKYGEGRRVFKMSPIHHHFQKEGIEALIQTPKKAIPEAKIVVRFWIITILLCAITVITLKIR